MTDATGAEARPLGLREEQRTRQHIAETARRLFAERGFERVPVTEIAARGGGLRAASATRARRPR